MNNNDIFKKLRVALQLRDEQIIEILALVDFRMEKAELNALFRSKDHPNFMECGDQVLRNFLNGLIIHLRGTKEEPKNAMDVINKNREEVKARLSSDKSKTNAPKNFTKKKPASNPKSRDKKPAPKVQVIEKVQFKNGKKKN
jgi:hypothetical protein